MSQVEGAVGCVCEDAEVRESLALGGWTEGQNGWRLEVGSRKGHETWNLPEASGQPRLEGGIPILSRLSGWADSKPG